VKSVEEGVVTMFAEDILKSTRREQSALESRYANCAMLERPKETIFIEYLREKIIKNCRGSSSFHYNDFHLPYIDFFQQLPILSNVHSQYYG
jgi:hypothetical protein